MSSDIVIVKDERVTALLDERHILDEDIKQVIAAAESTGVKLYQPDGDRCLAKLQTENATFYVEYSPAEEGYQIHTAYFHKSEIIKE
jgi:hypothetical protein